MFRANRLDAVCTVCNIQYVTWTHISLLSLKGIVHQTKKNKKTKNIIIILSSFTHSRIVTNLFPWETHTHTQILILTNNPFNFDKQSF